MRRGGTRDLCQSVGRALHIESGHPVLGSALPFISCLTLITNDP
jgi:hypothetical protein